MEAKSTLSHDDYTVGWICTLPVETAAAKLMLDEIHSPLPRLPMDQNIYILGSIREHNIVIATLPGGAYGTISAATVGMQLLSSFPAIRIGFLVGIGGGVPTRNADIRLGDIVVSQPTDTSGGVIQYDLGKAFSGHFQRMGMLNRPPKVLLTALATLQAHHLTEESRVVEFISHIQAKIPPRKATTFARPTQEDFLFQVEYEHVASDTDTCLNCDRSKLSPRPSRDHKEPVIHYGLIGSANQVVKHGRQRDRLARDLRIYCVEMEAVGLMNDFPCLVIRGISDYADSHKNKEWQGYAAAVAAAYAKELLLVIPIEQVTSTPTARNTLAESESLLNIALYTAHRFDVPLDLTAVPVIENFLGRQDELDQLWQYLKPNSSQARKVAILHGLGGIGKTQLAIRFARDRKFDFTAIFWLSGKDRVTLLQSLSSILPRLPGQSQNTEASNDEEVEQRANYVLRWLALKDNSRWLIIFDNIDQYFSIDDVDGDTYDIGKFFPAADHGSILLTSRPQDITELGKPFPVHRLDSKDTIRLLLESSHLLERNAVNTLALADRLGGLPLAIVIAGAFMRQTGTNITEYLQYYQESWSDLQLQSNPGRQYQQGNMLQTWTISYHEIQKRDPKAAELLLLFAHFDNRDIWYGLVKGGCHSPDATSNELTFKINVKTLIGFSLLETTQQGGSYAMHPVVQNWCLHIASADKVHSIRLNNLALISVGYTVPSARTRNYSDLQQRLIAHANFVRHRDWSGDNITVLGALLGFGGLYSNQGKLKEGEEVYQQALIGYEKALGPNHTSTLVTVNNLGILYSDQGKLKEAEEMYQRALAGYENDPMPTLSTVNNLGNLYSNQGKLKEAEEMFRRALAGYEKALGPGHTSTITTVNNLSLLYHNQGKLKAAGEMYQRALAGYNKALGPDHTSTLVTVNNLGNLYRDQGKLKAADEMYQRALAGYEKALGPDHTSTLNTVNNLGNLYRYQGKLKVAEEIYQRALAGYEKALGPDHTSTLNTVNNLGLLYSDQGKLKAAEEMYQRTLVGKDKTLGPDHTSTLETVNNIGLLYSNQGKLKEANEMYERALAGFDKALGPDHTSTLTTVNNLGNLYKHQGRLKEAEEMYQRALRGTEKALGPDHTSTLETINGLGNLYKGQGMLKEAEKMCYRALTGYEKTLGPDHMVTLNTVKNLGNLFKDQGKLKEAKDMYQRALAGYEKALGPDHSKIRRVMERLNGLSIAD
ncbi:uncharacterized protein N7482_010737 [Penicillium canariense]|uniref:NB-ARC domain-containing protein n=1 Tax=Penicillium canariense TaxID=189055 RepID=A0A9W9HMH2_9EURO|nr:uncharacterized protein N7482_010737 [Penicillium canariense]KAJ5151485.1 hypothetical protein N7482_010737 [Penicillium canariense]